MSKVAWWRGRPRCVHSAQRQDGLLQTGGRPGPVSRHARCQLGAAGAVVGLVQDARCGQGQGSLRKERGTQAGPQPGRPHGPGSVSAPPLVSHSGKTLHPAESPFDHSPHEAAGRIKEITCVKTPVRATPLGPTRRSLVSESLGSSGHPLLPPKGTMVP